MGKIKETFQKMSLKKSLLVLAVFCLSLVGILSIVTILKCSDIRQEILDTRPIIITDYIIDDTNKNDMENNNGVTAIPQKYTHGELSKENQVYYWCITILMVSLPIAYIIIASFMVAKLYYKWKLQIPLENLKNGMDYISQQDLDFQIQYSSNDELGQLCDTFEHMKNEIYKSNRKMWNMLQERKALTASVSHDLRTPITVINGYLEYLEKSIERGTLTNETLQTTIKNMTEAADRLKRYVECVKDIQRIEDIEIKKKNYDLKELIANITKEFSILAAQKNKKVIIQDFSKSAFILTDKAMLSKILENIFDNALRFSSEKIVFSIKEKEEYLYFSIQDDGVGFTSEELESATSFFFSSSTNGGNFGIGLSICKILCEKFGGDIFLDNISDHGAIITIKIKK
ncbi:HAMP domain-containing sensor histidine kinase [Mediterraneibacter gnavus]|mgnify:CR=1 FL=1|uniref:histidine kinase n=1 Tax=Mediterraneibacter gnavus TaxID=33038 RepID=A0A9X3KBU7_MEDGN|nr:HAMP domain-containing sensor histidine kinase [Mediterraneibacter gnavus]MCZ7693444.1 HAMP domain-containing sensor histidine kinase [Mediterraneibacter gnavus]MCZ7734835.1 HAMP domain-containing sensor histidine kinase [Mediterraneibacter gnavus]MDC6147334.1 HAMP domain-containing sensor histidine kinase [Mediterraneibacter gnavus]MDE1200751.1 HAMP domain-containing sensor histidine kinase [Mediterraneibacter gnavus]